ncbi:hypothetical protein AARAC_000841 [Aspergillus arachidicola]|uniref:BZIP domain-containing protein n=1 Tax=Aspergillus arachidicola TaxID=656916 RepID=A0A2G7G4Y7_9EURO|nr:hypothetical protein AARAC_000841 [Aspergillus arachidicola]
MEHYTSPLSSVLVGAEANRVGDQPNHADKEAEASNKQRRKVQNRKNQRARRLRLRQQDPGPAQTSHPFEVNRWRLDEHDDCRSQGISSALKAPTAARSSHSPHTFASTSILEPEGTRVCDQQPGALFNAQTFPAPPPFIFPLSADHLIHLIQYNVFRAFVSNKRSLNTQLMCSTDNHPSSITCPISGPYSDDTIAYPLNPNIPLSLVPTRLQQTRLHSFYIKLFPFPRVRDNLIRREGSFDHWELLHDLFGDLLGAIPTRERQPTSLAITVPDPNSMCTSPLIPRYDEDEVTAERKGLIVWGEPHHTRSWEATPRFLAKWSWAVKGCDDLIESTNHWRMLRGEKPLCLFESEG